MTNPEIYWLIKQFAFHDQAGEVLKKLVPYGSEAVIPLCRALKDEDWNIRRCAAIALGLFKDARAVEPLLQALGDKDSSIRRNAAGSLVKIGSPAVKPLVQKLDDADEAIRWYAVRILKQMGDNLVLEPFIQALGNKDPGIRHYSTTALGRLRETRAVESLIRVMGDREPSVRQNAVDALIKIGAPAVKPLIQVLRDENPHVRQNAIEVLKEIGDGDTVARRVLAETSLTPQQRFIALTALQSVPDISEYCQQKLHDLHETVRQGAQEVLHVSSLLIPSRRDETGDKKELLRGAEPSVSHEVAEEMLRASDGAPFASSKPLKRRGLLARLLGVMEE